MGDELAALAPAQRRRHRDLDAELVGLVWLAFADALHLGCVQAVDLRSSLPLTLLAHPPGQRQRPGEDRPQARILTDLAADIADHPAKQRAQCPQRPVGALELLGVHVALMLDQGPLADAA